MKTVSVSGHPSAEPPREPTDRYHAYIANSPLAMMVVDACGRYVDVNPAACCISGYEEAELLAMSLTDLLSEESLDAGRQHFAAVKETGRASGEMCWIRKDGAKRWSVCNAVKLSEERFAAYLLDITDRKQAESILAAERDLARGLANARRLDAVVPLCLDAALANSGLECGGIYLVDHATGRLELARHVGLSTAFLDSLSSIPADSPRAQVVKQGRTVETSRSRLEELGLATELAEGLSLALAIPVMHEQHPVACLNMASRSVTAISPQTRMALEALAVQMGAAIVRAQAEEALRQSEYRQTAILDSIPDPAWLKDKAGHFLALNAAWYQFFGLEAESVVGKTAFDFLPVELAEYLAEQDRGVMQSRRPLQLEEMLPDKDGRMVWFETIKTPLLNDQGEVVGTAGLARDITKRKRVEQAIRASEEKYRGIFDESVAAIYVFDNQKHFLDANQAGLDLLGYSRDELLRLSIPDVDVDLVGVLPAHQTLLSGGRLINYEHQLRRKDGTVITVLNSSRPLTDAEGAVVGMQSTLLDITARKQAEAALREKEQQLFHAQKLESLGILAGGIAHDFNNILAGIMGYADLVRVRLAPSDPARDDIDVIKKAVQRAADLTRQMLAYSGKGKFVVETVHVSRVVEDTQKMLEVSVSRKATLKYHLASDLPAILADASQVHQVILNLVINASDALGENSGVIAVSTDTVSLNNADCAAINGSSDLREGRYVRLEVTDTGCGMDEQTLEKIFDPFFTTKFTGRGLGLAAVHGIVQGHKGGLRVVSTPGQGTTFQVFFPACDVSAPVATAESVSAQPWRGVGTVLIVDDEELVRALASRMVEYAGFSVLTAQDGEEALCLYRQHQSDITCVLLDLTMPKMDGAETFQELRRISPEVRVILSSGYSEEGAIERFAGAGLAGFIQKPYDVETMLTTLRKAVAQG